MALGRAEALEKIESQRRAIREHIEKYQAYRHLGDTSAQKTIANCQERIRDYKRRCDAHIPDSYEDTWQPEM